MIINHRGQQVMCRCDGMKITSEVQVHVFHWYNLSIATPGSAALHPKTRAQRSFSYANCGFLADSVQAVAQADRRRGFAFTGRRRVYSSHQYQLAAILVRD